MNEKMTPWFRFNTPPVRAGVYNVSCQTQGQSGRWFSHFDGKHWARAWERSVDGALESAEEVGHNSEFRKRKDWTWRGLAEQPWIEWKGGECPVDRFVQVEVQLASGTRGPARADYWDWTHENNSSDIVFYRVLEGQE